MINFADEATIEVYSGKGGNGCVAFRREKYIPKGGPNGGDGGKGGSVVFRVKDNMRTLSKIRHHRIYKAQNGGDGMGQNRHGKDGSDIIIDIPPGTILRDFDTGSILHDTADDTEPFVFLAGGKGGWGNTHFKSSVNQAPRYAHEGTSGGYAKLHLEMNIIADIGLVGHPNAGKSSLLNVFTNARPKIAPYPFTTKVPHLGVLRVDDNQDIVIADIPGILAGASRGVGLGFDFLKHISRTRALVFMLDMSTDDYLDAYDTLVTELHNYNDELLAKPRLVLCNKIDLENCAERAAEVAQKIHIAEPNTVVISTSVLCNMGLGNSRSAIIEMYNKAVPPCTQDLPSESGDLQDDEGDLQQDENDSKEGEVLDE